MPPAPGPGRPVTDLNPLALFIGVRLPSAYRTGIGADAVVSDTLPLRTPHDDAHRRPGSRREDPRDTSAVVDLDSALIAAQRGDERAFTMLYRAAQPSMFRYARILVGADAEEVCAESWLGIARDLPSFRGDFAAFKGWSAKIVRNRAIDWGRAQTRHATVPLDMTDEPDAREVTDAAEDAAVRAATDAAIALIASLPRDQAEAVFLRSVIGMDAAMAGSVLDKSAGAVRVAAHRGLRELRRRLGRTTDEDESSREGNAPTDLDAQGMSCETD